MHQVRFFCRGAVRETLFAGEVEKPKPSPEPLLEMVRRLRVTMEACCYVGDSLLDMQMSKAAGISGYGITTGHNTVDELRVAGAVDVFSSLTEFPPACILKSFLGVKF